MKARIQGTEPGGHYELGPGDLSPVEFARWYRDRTLAQWERLDLPALERIARMIEGARDAGRFIWVCGNGGSTAIAAHVGCDLGKTAGKSGAKPIKCISLSGNMPLTTAIANDLSFENAYAYQLGNVLSKGDVVLLISGSGNSPNLIAAAKLAHERGAKTAALLGFDGGRLKSLCDEILLIPSDQYGVIEDLHMAVAHILTFYLKQSR